MRANKQGGNESWENSSDSRTCKPKTLTERVNLATYVESIAGWRQQ
jgi:hypothetical protein